MSVDHYENFPVASLLLPAQLRSAVAVIYHFARSADDIADEGDLTDQERLHQLACYDEELCRIRDGKTTLTAAFARLGDVIRQHKLSIEPFRDLISAFQQDVSIKRYDNFTDLLDYCSRSANPVGRIMLELYNKADPVRLHASDAICSSLQIINFLQDVAIDREKNRIYLPKEDLDAFGISEQDILDSECSAAWRKMMQFQIRRARTMMQEGAWLAKSLPGRIGWELRLVISGGLRILDKLDAVHGDIYRRRPVLQKADWLHIIWHSIFKFSYRQPEKQKSVPHQ